MLKKEFPPVFHRTPRPTDLLCECPEPLPFSEKAFLKKADFAGSVFGRWGQKRWMRDTLKKKDEEKDSDSLTAKSPIPGMDLSFLLLLPEAQESAETFPFIGTVDFKSS